MGVLLQPCYNEKKKKEVTWTAIKGKRDDIQNVPVTRSNVVVTEGRYGSK